MYALELPPISSFTGVLRPPGSKSIANRALPLAALARGATQLENLPDGEDVVLMRRALEKLGIPIGPPTPPALGNPSEPALDEATVGETLIVEGQGSALRAPGGEISLFLGNSGTTTRILGALLSAGDGIFHLDGVPRMRERPIEDLVEALLPLAGNTRIAYEGKEGFPPLRIEAKGLAGGYTRIRGNISSQFTTGLLMALPLCHGSAEVEVQGTLVSAPYVELTLEIMKSFGAAVEREGLCRFWIGKPGGYRSPGVFSIEPDASSASYFMAAAAISGGPVTVRGLSRESAQGEIGFAEVLRRMGARVEYGTEGITVSNPGAGRTSLRGVDADMDAMSDTGMTLAVTALFAEGPTVIRNVGNWRLKETDRLAAMAAELRKVGARVEEGEDSLIVHPPATLNSAEIDTYDDHRMAMCFSLVSLGRVPIVIRDPGCVRKTYPGYFDDFRRLAGIGSVRA